MIPKGYDYDDVLIIPHYSELQSRTNPAVDTYIAKDCPVAHPIIPANMDCISGYKMAQVQRDNGGGFIWHRHHKPLESVMSSDFFTVGMRGWYDSKTQWHTLIEYLVTALNANICIDIAHAHTKGVLDSVSYIKSHWPETKLMVGNIATGDAARDLCNAGVDSLKVGIGGGFACTTRKVTGCGVPNLTAIHWVYKVTRDFDTPIIADGGIRDSNDVAKALAAGASAVMMGRMFAGTKEAEGQWFDGPNPVNEKVAHYKIYEGSTQNLFRQYWGQSSEEFQNKHYGGMKNGVRAEGDEKLVPYVGDAQSQIDNVIFGLKSAMTYVGASTVDSFRRKAEFIEV